MNNINSLERKLNPVSLQFLKVFTKTFDTTLTTEQEENLESLASDPNYETRFKVARQPTITHEIGLKLGMDDSIYVKYATASNPYLTEKLVEELFRKTEDKTIKEVLIMNPNFPNSLKTEILSTPPEDNQYFKRVVSQFCKLNETLFSVASQITSTTGMHYLALNEHLTSQQLEYLWERAFTTKNSEIENSIILRKTLPDELLVKIFWIVSERQKEFGKNYSAHQYNYFLLQDKKRRLSDESWKQAVLNIAQNIVPELSSKNVPFEWVEQITQTMVLEKTVS